MAGFFGSIGKNPCINDVFYGTDYHSHLGTRRAGIATYDASSGTFNRVIHSISQASFRAKMEEELPRFIGNAGIGIISDTDAQPLLFNSHLGRFALSTVGRIANLEELATEILQSDMHLSEFSSGKVNPTELVGLLIIQKDSIVEGIRNAQAKIKGSLSLIMLTEDGIVCARDSWGRTPVILGQKEDAYCVVSESSSFLNLGYTHLRDLGPGEIVRLRPEGVQQLAEPYQDHMQMCAFLWVYYGFPTSNYEGRNVEDVRNYIGYAMGKEDDTPVDCCCGVPDSGIGMAVGYSEGHNVIYRRAISKYTPTWPRSFMPANQNMRDLVAKMKLIQNNAILRVTPSSAVRSCGTTPDALLKAGLGRYTCVSLVRRLPMDVRSSISRSPSPSWNSSPGASLRNSKDLKRGEVRTQLPEVHQTRNADPGYRLAAQSDLHALF